MGQIIAYVPEDAATVHHQSSIPVVEEDGMSQFPEWCSQNDEQSRWHDKSVFVHWQVVMNSVKEEMQRDTHSVVGKDPGI